MRNGGVVIAVALTAALLVSPGCGGGGHVAGGSGGPRPGKALAARTGWASPKELRWLREYGVWQDQIADFASRADRAADITSVTAALTGLSSCGQLLKNDLGPAPTARLERIASMLRRACSDWRHAGLAALTAGKSGSSRIQGIRARVRRAARTMEEANSLLPPGENQSISRGAPSPSQSRVVPLFNRVATRLAGRPAEVRCWTAADWNRLVREEREVSVSHVDQRAAGITSLASARENLRPEICARLATLAAGRRGSGDDQMKDAFALLVLAHESQHAAGIPDEVLADCRGMQTMRRAGVLLGIPSAYAQRLAEDYWHVYPQQPRIYVSPECRAGGRLDMRPHDPTWP